MNEAVQEMRKLETLVVEGRAADVITADRMAWEALESVLGIDPVGAWTLKVMQHGFFKGEVPGVEFHAEFLRDTNYDEEAAGA